MRLRPRKELGALRKDLIFSAYILSRFAYFDNSHIFLRFGVFSPQTFLHRRRALEVMHGLLVSRSY